MRPIDYTKPVIPDVTLLDELRNCRQLMKQYQFREAAGLLEWLCEEMERRMPA